MARARNRLADATFATLLLLALAPDARAQRLPTTVSPSHYDLRVAPDLAAATFAGDETIAVTLGSPATTVVLNAAEIDFKKVEITAAGKTQSATVTLDAAKDQATLAV